MAQPITRSTRRVTFLTTLLVFGLALFGLAGSPSAPQAAADTAPPPGTPATVTARPLPTVQINGVVWSQTVVGNTVYAGGNFSSARPAGSAPGVNTVPRTNLLAYDIRTGKLITSFNPKINGQVLSVTRSPDGSRVYIGGQFTTVNGQKRERIAAFTTSNNALLSGFAPSANSSVRAMAATNSTLYVGGGFSNLAGKPRPYAGAVNASNGSATAYNPGPNFIVHAMTLNPSRSRVILGGRFSTVGGKTNPGLAATLPTTGAPQSFPVNQVVQNFGDSAAILALTADNDSIYGTGFSQGGGNFEGTFKADGETGKLEWISDCHGDGYSVFASGDVIYNASHHHYCGNIPDGYQEYVTQGKVPAAPYYHALAFSKAVGGPNDHNPVFNYESFDGRPSPRLLHWYPVWETGTFTGQTQAVWNVTGNSDYVVYGGEFPSVNGVAQQGLVRFARNGIGSNRPPVTAVGTTPSAVSVEAGTVDVGWQATFDRDNRNLTYRLTRINPDNSSTLVYTTTVASKPWERPTIAFRDEGLTPGSTVRYRVDVADLLNASKTSAETSVVVAGTNNQNQYGRAVIDSKPEHWYRLNEGSGSQVTDVRGSDHLTAAETLTRNVAGASGDGDRATTFSNSSSSYATGAVAQRGPQTFSLEAWVRTSSAGRIVGFGNVTGGSTTNDRVLFIDDNGVFNFGLLPSESKQLTSGPGFDDNKWHHVVATLGSTGARLYVDGDLLDSDTSMTAARDFTGFWRVGADDLWWWDNQPVTSYLAGSVDEVAVYHRVLSASEVAAHFAAAKG